MDCLTADFTTRLKNELQNWKAGQKKQPGKKYGEKKQDGKYRRKVYRYGSYREKISHMSNFSPRRREERETGTETIFEKMMVENFPEWMEDIYL